MHNHNQAAGQKIEVLDAEIAELAAHMSAATYRLLVRIREFDQMEGYAYCGCASTARWLNFRIGLDMGAAREKVRVALALEKLPILSAACERGAISYSKLRALTRIAKPETEAELLVLADNSTATHIERLVRAYRQVDRLDAAKQEAERFLSVRFDDDGMVVIQGRLLADEGAFLLKALRAQDTPNMADALVSLVDTNAKQEVEVSVHIDAEVLAGGAGRCEIEGEGVSAETMRRLCCDASIVPIVHDAASGEVLSVGRKSRKLSASLRRALHTRDNGCCKFPGCTNRMVDAHHITHWADGGATALGNLATACRFHHRLLHEHGYTVDHDFVFRDPTGNVLKPAGAAPPLTSRIEETNRAFAITSNSMDTWKGHPFDMSYVTATIFHQEQLRGLR